MKKVASIVILLYLFTNVVAAGINGQHSSSPTLCDASAESSEEKCDSTNPASGPLRSEHFQVRYLLYKNYTNPDEYQEIFINNSISILEANPFPKEKAMWKILVHGFTNHKSTSFPVNVKKAYLENLQQNPDKPINILVVDWGEGAKKDWFSLLKRKGIYQHAVENVEIAGENLGDMITFLHNKGWLDIARGVHLVGHSLGAHVSGQAARRVYTNTKLLVWRISGLDPAGPLFWNNAVLWWFKDPYPRLHRSRAAFLDVYHTSEWYGSTAEMGDVDFYINGGESQPDCNTSWWWIPWYSYLETQSCSHQFATVIFAKSINYKKMIACTGCWNYEEYHNGTCGVCEEEDETVLGEYVDENSLNGYPLASGQAFYDIKDLKP